jgi:VIT1/CCC1 family predicted Fe2+/Mn2+ transporter
MPSVPHLERHFTAGASVRDVVIGMADGLTVPFALAAGLSGAVDASKIVVVAGLAEIAAGSIAMGLGGYLAARSDAEHYASERKREQSEVVHRPKDEVREVQDVFRRYGLTDKEIEPIIAAFQNHHENWVDFMMRFELGLEKPEESRAYKSAGTIAASYVAGGCIPLAPYLFIHSAHAALAVSASVTAVALAVFGYVKGHFTGAKPLRSAVQTLAIGSIAAAAAFGLAKLLS